MRFALITTLLLFAANASAATITIDFEDPDIDLGPALGDNLYEYEGPVHTQGFTFTAGQGAFFLFPGPDEAGNDVLAWGQSGSMRFERDDLGAFDLISFSLFLWEGASLDTVIARKAEGDGYLWSNGWCGTLDTGANQYCPDAFDNEYADFTDLTSVSIETYNGPAFIDNIVVSQVPVPATLWLFGSALAGLGWLKRRQIG